MSTVGIFILGAFVTALVAGALALVIIGAIQDGRLARQARANAAVGPDRGPAGVPAQSGEHAD